MFGIDLRKDLIREELFGEIFVRKRKKKNEQ